MGNSDSHLFVYELDKDLLTEWSVICTIIEGLLKPTGGKKGQQVGHSSFFGGEPSKSYNNRVTMKHEQVMI